MADIDIVALERRVRTLEQSQVSGRQTNINLTDSAGVLRIEAGVDLPAKGVSPAQAGMRVNDATGTPIWDSAGLIKGMTRIATTAIGGSSLGLTGSYQTISGSTTSFTLDRQQTILALGVVASFTGIEQGGALVNVYVDGVQYAGGYSGNTVYSNNGGGVVLSQSVIGSATAWASLSLAAGSHTADWRALQGNAGQTLTVMLGQLDVFLVGS